MTQATIMRSSLDNSTIILRGKLHHEVSNRTSEEGHYMRVGYEKFSIFNQKLAAYQKL